MSVTPITPGPACPTGGVQIVALGDGGITTICNGAAGVDGTTGLQGPPGASVAVTALQAGDAHCPQGGTVLTSSTGLSYACNGAPGPPGPSGTFDASTVIANGSTPQTASFNVTGDGVIGGTLSATGKTRIGTTSQVGMLTVGGSIASANGQVQRDVFTYNTSATDTLPTHLKTQWRTNNSAMYRIVVEGYNYGAAAAVNSDCVGYLYSATDTIISGACTNYAPGVTLTQYRSTDGYLVLKLASSSSFYLGFTVSVMTLNPVGTFSTTFTASRQAANL